jgi:hypothetical protein
MNETRNDNQYDECRSDTLPHERVCYLNYIYIYIYIYIGYVGETFM